MLAQGPLHFRFWPGGEALARHVAAIARAYPPLPGLPADVLARGQPVEVDLAPDRPRWDSLTGGAIPSWSAGIAVPGQARIVIPTFGPRMRPSDMGEILRHELAHLALNRYLAPAAVPRWFDEGYATWVSGGMDWQAAWMLRLAFLLHRAPALKELDLDWPAPEAEARLAYTLSASAVSLLAERAGPRGLQLLFLRWRETGSLDLALRRAFGITLGQFEVEWRREVQRRYGWAMFLSDTLVFWLLLLPILVVLVLVRRRRDRERLARLRASEPPDVPAWWNEESPTEGPDEPPPASLPPASPPPPATPPETPPGAPT